MRMWLVHTQMMCRKHLLGEHVELHMLVGSMKRRLDLSGFYDNKLIDPHRIRIRHNDLVWEMIDRGYNHRSELILPPDILEKYPSGTIDISANRLELHRRCEDCRKRIDKWLKT